MGSQAVGVGRVAGGQELGRPCCDLPDNQLHCAREAAVQCVVWVEAVVEKIQAAEGRRDAKKMSMSGR